jgi:hypothetical protein
MTKSTIKRFINYWWESAKDTKEWFDLITWVLVIVFWVIVALGGWAEFQPQTLKYFSDPTIHKISLILAGLLTARAVLWIPFKRHEKQELKIKSLENPPASFEVNFPSRTIPFGNDVMADMVIFNRRREQTAKNVQIELIQTSDNTGLAHTLPLDLTPRSHPFNPPQPVIIHPGAEYKFPVFTAHLQHGVATIGQPNPPSTVIMEFLRERIFFKLNTNYQWTIRITADNFPPTELNFILHFNEANGEWRFYGEQILGIYGIR